MTFRITRSGLSLDGRDWPTPRRTAVSNTSTFVPLLVITVLAAFVPLLVSRLPVIRLPIVVGEILAGIVIGKSGFNLVQSTPILDFLAEFGFVFLMFLSGLEVSLDSLFAAAGADGRQSRWARPIPLAGIIFVLTVSLGISIGFGLETAGLVRNPVLMGLILSTTSLGIVVPVLKERGLTVTPYGQTVLITALISDFVTLLLLSVEIAIVNRGAGLDLLLVLVLFVAFVAAAAVGRWTRRWPALARITEELSHATAQFRVRGAFALMIVWVVLSDALGVEVILGAFLAGAVISVSRHGANSPLREKLEAIGYGFFIPLFFIMVGAGFDLPALLVSPRALALVGVLLVAAYAVKFLPALLLRQLFSWRETWAAGALISSRLSLIIAASAIALSTGMITPSVNSALILVAVVTCTVSPVLFGRILGARQVRERKGVIIVDTDQQGRLLAGRLRRAGEPVVFVGADAEQADQVRRAGYTAIAGNPVDAAVLALAGAADARALVALARAPETVLAVSRLATAQFQIPTVIARVDDPGLARDLATLQVQVVQPAMATVIALESALRFPLTFSILTEESDDVDLLDVRLYNRALAGRTLSQVRLPGNVLVLGIRRQGEIVVPHGATVLHRGDTLMLLGGPLDLRDARALLESHAPRAGSNGRAPHEEA